MTETITVQQGLERATGALDEVSKDLDTWMDKLTKAEEEWEEHYDTVAESLEEESTKSPAEHKIRSTARRQKRALYQDWQRAKRMVSKLEQQSQLRRSELSGWQSQLKNLGAEAEVQDHLSQRPTHPVHFSGRR